MPEETYRRIEVRKREVPDHIAEIVDSKGLGLGCAREIKLMKDAPVEQVAMLLEATISVITDYQPRIVD